MGFDSIVGYITLGVLGLVALAAVVLVILAVVFGIAIIKGGRAQ